MDALLTLPFKLLGIEGWGGISCCRVFMPIRYLCASLRSAILDLEALPEIILLQGKPLLLCRDVRVYGLGSRAGPTFIFLLVGCATRVSCSIACCLDHVFELWFLLLFSDLYFTLSHLDTSICSCANWPCNCMHLLVSCAAVPIGAACFLQHSHCSCLVDGCIADFALAWHWGLRWYKLLQSLHAHQISMLLSGDFHHGVGRFGCQHAATRQAPTSFRDVRVYGLGSRAGPAFTFLLVGWATRVSCSITVTCSFCNVFELWFVLLFSDLYFTLSHLDTSMCSCANWPCNVHAPSSKLCQ